MTEATNDLNALLAWKGQTQSSVEVISTAYFQRLAHLLNQTEPLTEGAVVPALWHFVAHLDSVPLGEHGRDGHPKRGGFLPPVALPRRMWAGGRLTFHDDIHFGDTLTKTSTVHDIVIKEGRSGTLCFVTVHHELAVDGNVRIFEEQDLVYRDDPAPDAPKPQPKPAPDNAQWSRAIEPSPVMLFRYSALTNNAHRIHYDRDYARDVEGYEGLVFHGPLTATLLADLAVTQTGRQLATFSFRGMSPLFDTAPFTVNATPNADDDSGNTIDLWAATPGGGLAMQASATLR